MLLNVFACLGLFQIIPMASEQTIEITINYRGNDVSVNVTPEVAEMLLNDNDLAERCAQEVLAEEAGGAEQGNSKEKVAEKADENFQIIKQNVVWGTKWRGEENIDTDATKLFLELRYKLSSKFNDRKTIKNNLWLHIAKEMKVAGFNVGEGKEGAEKCRQKFANLQRSYISYITKSKKTGEGVVQNPPPYFDILHSILKDKNKIDPPYLEDSLSENSTTSEPSTSGEGIRNRFSSIQNKVAPRSNTEKILEQLQRQHEDDKRQRDEQFSALQEALRKQNEQRDKFLDLFQLLVEKKRKRKDSDSE